MQTQKGDPVPGSKQFEPAGQVRPHAPQLLVVLSAEQTPLQQLRPPPQLVSQPPQWNESLWVFTHAPSQQVSPAAQQFVPVLPVHKVLSHGQTLHCLSQQYWETGQQTRPSAPPHRLVPDGQD